MDSFFSMFDGRTPFEQFAMGLGICVIIGIPVVILIKTLANRR